MAAKLADYDAKRDFEKTQEPSGKAQVAPSDRLRFVIQKHDATRLHYDLRLEWEGVFKSWAVTKGPSLDPAERRLAVEVEDHPLAYGDFEGTIPKGEYGGGTVMLWDRGFYAPVPGTTVEDGLKKGDLKVVLEGEKLHGEWVLVRMHHDRNGPKKGTGPGRKSRTNWLLIKHKDGTEHGGDRDALLEKHAESVASGRSLEAIASGAAPGPTTFMTNPAGKAAKRTPAKRVWNSNRGDPEASAEAVAQLPSPSMGEGPGMGVKTRGGPKTLGDSEPSKKRRAPTPPSHDLSPIEGERSRMPPFIPFQLATSVDRPPAGDAWAHEIKFDGYRLQLRIEGGKCKVLTRSGLDWTDRFPEIAVEAAHLPDAVIDGEAVALDADGSPDFAGLQAALSSQKTGELVFYAFDLLWADDRDLRALPVRERKSALQALLEEADRQHAGRLRYVEHFETGGEAVLSSACSMHLEGIVSKRLDAPYRSGRSDTWVKAKCRGGQEVIVVGYTTNGPDQFRSLIAAVHRDGTLVHVGRVGTGFGAAKVKALLPKLKAAEAKASPFSGKGAPKGGAGVHWLKPVLVAEIESAGWTGDGHLRQASFKALREDKPADEVVQETPEAVEEIAGQQPKAAPKVRAAKALAAAKPVPVIARPNVVMGVTISNPDKPLWLAEDGGDALTKRDLALYFEAVGEAMLPHLVGRPCSVIREPDGVGGESFFQRHAMPGTSSLLTLAHVRDDKTPYIQIDRVEALAAVAQTAGVELHPWNCAPDRYEVAGRLVFDLDPAPDVDFQAVIEGAREIKDRLEELGLTAFCKTTGGKGLHVVTPLDVSGKRGVEWAQAKVFARQVCEAMAADDPDRYLVNMSKAKRTGKIFLDYLRNDRLSTAVAPYSPRGRPHAPVSWPVSWTQVKRGLDPLAYTMRTAPALVAKNKAWAGYDDAARPLGPAIKALGGAKAA